jgi:hypothetical protein
LKKEVKHLKACLSDNVATRIIIMKVVQETSKNRILYQLVTMSFWVTDGLASSLSPQDTCKRGRTKLSP